MLRNTGDPFLREDDLITLSVQSVSGEEVATLAMHTMLSRMVMFQCTICKERFPTFLPAYRLPDELDLDLLGRPRTCKGKARLPPCCMDLVTWEEAPPLEELQEEAIVVLEYTGCCLSCHRDVRNELQKLQQVDPNAVEHDVIPLRGWQNRIDSCYRFPWHDLADLFASATVTEARFIALEHMQIDFATASSTVLRKFRGDIISFPQSVDRAVRRHGLLRGFRVGNRVDSRRGPGVDVDRAPVRAVDASAEARQQYTTDKDGYLVFPATVTRVEGVERVFLKYDHAGDEEFSERVEWLLPRLRMPWHLEQLQ